MAPGVDVLSGWWWWQRLLYLALVANCYTRTSRDLQQYPQLPLEPDECPLTLFYLFINFNFAKILQVRATPASAKRPQSSAWKRSYHNFSTFPGLRTVPSLFPVCSSAALATLCVCVRFHFVEEQKYDLVASFALLLCSFCLATFLQRSVSLSFVL